MELGLKDKVAIVTGSGRGIGQAIALKFAHQQAKVVVVDRNEKRADETVKMVENTGGKAISLGTDVTKLNEVQLMLENTLEAFGDIHILVNNAGWSMQKDFFESPVNRWDALIDLNLKSSIYTCRVVGEVMRRNGYGKIVNIASDAARMGSPDETVYAAAKGGIITLTKSLAISLAPQCINVNCVSPGIIDTPMVQNGLAMGGEIEAELERRREVVPFKRYGKPEEIADAVLFLASEAASYITGQILSVNGGISMMN
jgi:2-hydroxycyclohexanecarboxyl-CoA dehydrogenase